MLTKGTTGVSRSVVTANLTNVFSAWCGVTSAADRRRLDAFIRRSWRSRFVPPNPPPLTDLCRALDEKLFNGVINDDKHVPHKFLPVISVASQNYKQTVILVLVWTSFYFFAPHRRYKIPKGSPLPYKYLQNFPILYSTPPLKGALNKWGGNFLENICTVRNRPILGS